jgi:DNA repair protein RadC
MRSYAGGGLRLREPLCYNRARPAGSVHRGVKKIAASPSVEYHLGLKQLPVSIRPRERLQRYGAESLSASELLAIILRTGTQRENVLEMANSLLALHRGLEGLSKASVSELCQQVGLGPAKAAQLKAAFELGRRLGQLEPGERPQVRSPGDIARLMFGSMSHLEQESLKVVLLNTKNRVIDEREVCRGSLNSAAVRVGEIFREPIRQNAAAVILVHNHPSGDPTPSPEDVRLTAAAREAGDLLDLEVLDHVIIGRQDFVSLRERGLGFGSRPERAGLG